MAFSLFLWNNSFAAPTIRDSVGLFKSSMFHELLTLRLSDLVRLNANGKKSAWPPSPFKPTGACSKSNGTSRKRSEHACWFRGCSGGTLLAYGWIQQSRTGIRRDRWLTMRKWQLLFRNCKWPRTHDFRFLCFLWRITTYSFAIKSLGRVWLDPCWDL